MKGRVPTPHPEADDEADSGFEFDEEWMEAARRIFAGRNATMEVTDEGTVRLRSVQNNNNSSMRSTGKYESQLKLTLEKRLRDRRDSERRRIEQERQKECGKGKRRIRVRRGATPE